VYDQRFIFFRPENEREKAGAYRNVINVVDDQMLVFDPQDWDQRLIFKLKLCHLFFGCKTETKSLPVRQLLPVPVLI
jgi:hypothetical protein